MKKILFTVILLCCFIFSSLSAENMQFYQANGTYYTVNSEISESHATLLAEQLDAYFKLFNKYFHFHTGDLNYKLKVRILKDKSSFDSYLKDLLPKTRDSYVYLQYNNPSKNELVGYLKSEAEFRVSLIHHGMLQLLKTFVQEPPLWLQKGFAIFFEKSIYNDDQKIAVYKENLAWVNLLKSIIRDNNIKEYISITELTAMDVSQANEKINSFYAESWGLVYFLINSSNKTYNRILWDTIAALKYSADTKDTTDSVTKESFAWVNKSSLQNDFESFILSIDTFRDLVQKGMQAYGNDNLDASEKFFTESILLDDTHPIPYYYLGLINYSRKKYDMAEYYYQTSLQMGGEKSLTNYALGVNSYYNERYDDAVEYLNIAAKADSKEYSEKAEELIEKIRSRASSSSGM